MLIKYVGQYAPVVIAIRADLGPIDLHDVIDVDDELGILLCEQVTNWVPGDDEAQAALDEFYRWVSLHERVKVQVDDLGNTEMRWVLRQPAAGDQASASPAAEPAARDGDPEPTTRQARRRSGSTDTTQEG